MPEMTSSFEKRKAKPISRLSLLLLLVSLAAILLNLGLATQIKHLPDGETETFFSVSTLAEFLKEIGFAAGIAFFLILTVERESREEFSKQIQSDLQNIKENVFSGTFRRNFPPELLAEIEETIFTQNFIRLQQDIHYELKTEQISFDVGRIGTFVRCQMSSMSVSRNITPHPQEMRVTLTVGKQPFESLNKRLVLVFESLDIDGTKVPIPAVDEVEDDYKRTCSYRIKSVPAGATVKVNTLCTSYKMRNDYEVWRTNRPVLALRLSINFPSEAHQFAAESIHRVELVERKTGDRSRSYSLDAPILPDQGFQFFWLLDNIDELSASTGGEASPELPRTVSSPLNSGDELPY